MVKTGKKLIINADDFGMLNEINEGVIEGIKKGVVTSLSLMLNMPGTTSALKFLRRNKKIASGIHLVITEGEPISPLYLVSSLVNSDGQFYNWPKQILRIFFKLTKLKEIEVEFMAQFNNYLNEVGHTPSHIDSHHHIHLYPSISPIVLKIAKKNKVNTIRSHHSKLFSWSTFWPLSLKKFIIRYLQALHRKEVRKNKLNSADFFVDMAWDNSLSKKSFSHMLQKLPNGIIEISCHPARIGKFETKNSPLLSKRQMELDLLLSAKIYKQILGFERTNYQELNDNSE